MANQTQTAVPKLKLKPVWREGSLALLSKPKPDLFDGHTIEEWAELGFDITWVYNEYNVGRRGTPGWFPYKWKHAASHGRCLKCGCTDEFLATYHRHNNENVGTCVDCTKRNT